MDGHVRFQVFEPMLLGIVLVTFSEPFPRLFLAHLYVLFILLSFFKTVFIYFYLERREGKK